MCLFWFYLTWAKNMWNCTLSDAIVNPCFFVLFCFVLCGGKKMCSAKFVYHLASSLTPAASGFEYDFVGLVSANAAVCLPLRWRRRHPPLHQPQAHTWTARGGSVSRATRSSCSASWRPWFGREATQSAFVVVQSRRSNNDVYEFLVGLLLV